MGYVLKCPDCKGKFRWTAEGMPDDCPLCGAFVGHTRGDDVIHMPAFLSPATKANDEIYREVERGSEARAQHAADMLGIPASEMSDLKITDMRSTKHQGEVAAPPVVNAVTQHMDAMRARGLPTGFDVPNAQELSQQVQTGPAPNAGARTRTMLQQLHGERSMGGLVSDIPALETQQPTYRRRA